MFLTQNCVGISVVAVKNAKFNTKEFHLVKKRGYFLEYWKIPNSETKDYSKNDLLSLWGKPNKKNNIEEFEYWIYRREVGFSGIVPEIIIPLPILIPSGYRHTILVFKNNNLESLIEEYGGKNYRFSCFLISLECTNSKTDAWRRPMAWF
ncbi:MAG: hypothetical protein ACJAW3_000007 [Lentimonas sp.]|jgi:hypothetical protein